MVQRDRWVGVGEAGGDVMVYGWLNVYDVWCLSCDVVDMLMLYDVRRNRNMKDIWCMVFVLGGGVRTVIVTFSSSKGDSDGES